MSRYSEKFNAHLDSIHIDFTHLFARVQLAPSSTIDMQLCLSNLITLVPNLRKVTVLDSGNKVFTYTQIEPGKWTGRAHENWAAEVLQHAG